MLTKDEIREISFSSYTDLVEYARKEFRSLVRNGMPPEEFVNEAILGLSEVTLPFESKKDVIAFLKNSVKTSFWHEFETVKNTKYTTSETRKGETFDITEKLQKQVVLTPIDSGKIYDLFEIARFGNSTDKDCPRCGSKRSYNTIRGDVGGYKCCSCGMKYSLISGTYLAHKKLNKQFLYRIVVVFCRDKFMSSLELSRWVGVPQRTTWAIKLLLDAVAHEFSESFTELNAENVLKRVLTLKEKDPKPITPRDCKLFTCKLSPEDIVNCKRLFEDGATLREIADIYEVHETTVREYVKMAKEKSVIGEKKPIIPPAAQRNKVCVRICNGEEIDVI